MTNAAAKIVTAIFLNMTISDDLQRASTSAGSATARRYRAAIAVGPRSGSRCRIEINGACGLLPPEILSFGRELRFDHFRHQTMLVA
jgi:hypothetical protein